MQRVKKVAAEALTIYRQQGLAAAGKYIAGNITAEDKAALKKCCVIS